MMSLFFQQIRFTDVSVVSYPQVIVEKVVEMPVERIVERVVEVFVDRIVEKVVTVEVEKPVRKYFLIFLFFPVKFPVPGSGSNSVVFLLMDPDANVIGFVSRVFLLSPSFLPFSPHVKRTPLSNQRKNRSFWHARGIWAVRVVTRRNFFFYI